MRIGIDLGGTKTELIALGEDGGACLRQRRPTPADTDPDERYAATLRLIADMVRQAENDLETRAGIGIGTPGSLQADTGRMQNCNSTCLNGKPLKQDIESILGRQVCMANDADCFVLSEAVDGAGRDADTVFGVILGTGVGGGIAVNGQVLAGVNGIAGEWGHNPLPSPRHDELPGPACYCGRYGCIETWLSGPGMAADHQRLTGHRMSARDIAHHADSGDTACRVTLERYYDRLARALAGVVNLLDPQVIVLGGGLSQIAGLYDDLPARWCEHVFSARVETRLLPPLHGDSSGVRGAAWLTEDV